jgi:hypothetical protein
LFFYFADVTAFGPCVASQQSMSRNHHDREARCCETKPSNGSAMKEGTHGAAAWLQAAAMCSSSSACRQPSGDVALHLRENACAALNVTLRIIQARIEEIVLHSTNPVTFFILHCDA